jgi:hypothetical protein
MKMGDAVHRYCYPKRVVKTANHPSLPVRMRKTLVDASVKHQYWLGMDCKAGQNARAGRDKMMVGGEEKNIAQP